MGMQSQKQWALRMRQLAPTHEVRGAELAESYSRWFCQYLFRHIIYTIGGNWAFQVSIFYSKWPVVVVLQINFVIFIRGKLQLRVFAAFEKINRFLHGLLHKGYRCYLN
jgi:hypothetical protein